MPEDKARLSELAERCKDAQGPDRELDRMISLTSNDRDERARINPPLFTASLDAAMTLVPEGWSVALHSHYDEQSRASVYLENNHATFRYAATPALALTAAALRARATPVDETDHA